MNKKNILKILLVFIALVLALFLLQGAGFRLFHPEATAGSVQKIPFRGNGVSIACSQDGRHVYAAGSGVILRSNDYGKSGSWEIVVTD